jgi:hypothetical protein
MSKYKPLAESNAPAASAPAVLLGVFNDCSEHPGAITCKVSKEGKYENNIYITIKLCYNFCYCHFFKFFLKNARLQ